MTPAWIMPNGPERMVELAQKFNILRGETVKWDALRMIARYGTASSGERYLISFLLDVWNMDQDDVPKFNAVLAMSSWDNANRKAFLYWATHPFNC